jgi:hypothetical protein
MDKDLYKMEKKEHCFGLLIYACVGAYLFIYAFPYLYPYIVVHMEEGLFSNLYAISYYIEQGNNAYAMALIAGQYSRHTTLLGWLAGILMATMVLAEFIIHRRVWKRLFYFTVIWLSLLSFLVIFLGLWGIVANLPVRLM